MNQINAVQFNGQELPKGAEWDMCNTWVNLPTGKKAYIMPGDWLIVSGGQYTEVLKNDEFLKRYSVEIVIKPKTDNMSENQNQKEPTFGEILVGLDFNPSARSDVDEVKQLCARLADIVEKGNGQETKYPYHANTFKGDAIRCILHAQMAAVKSLTFNK